MPLRSRVPDVVIFPEGSSSFFDAGIRDFPPIWKSSEIIWQSHGLVAYSTNAAVALPTNLSRLPEAETRFTLRLSDFHTSADTIAFTATFIDDAPHQWTGQDWLLIPLDNTSWALPTTVESDRHTVSGGAQWHSGQIVPGRGSTTHEFEFDPSAWSLGRKGHGRRVRSSRVVRVPASSRCLGIDRQAAARLPASGHHPGAQGRDIRGRRRIVQALCGRTQRGRHSLPRTPARHPFLSAASVGELTVSAQLLTSSVSAADLERASAKCKHGAC